MSLFDKLKKQAAEAIGNVVDNAGSKTYTITLSQLPVTPEQLKAMPEASLKQPEYTAALTVAALTLYPVDKDAALEMLEFLQ